MKDFIGEFKKFAFKANVLEAAPAGPTRDQELLTEIRDLLKK